MTRIFRYVTAFLIVSTFLVSPIFLIKAEAKSDNSTKKDAEVLGTVLRCSDKLPYIPVTVSCGAHNLSGETGSTNGDNGKYSLTFRNSSCKKGDVVTATARVNGNNYSNTGVIGTYFFFLTKAWVDVQTGSNCENGSNPNVPEFGIVTGLLALAGSAGSYFLLKRRAIKG